MQSLKQKTGLLVFIAIIIAQLLTGPLTIRNWPFTDYPMFSRAVDENKPAEILFLVDQFQDGSEVPWSRSSTGSVGPFDLRLQAYKNKPDDPELMNHVKKRVQDRNFGVKPEFVSVWKKSARVIDSKIIERQTLLKKYEFQTLSN